MTVVARPGAATRELSIDDLIDVRVEDIRQVAEGIRAFDLVPTGGAGLPPFAAGAHIDVHVGGFVRSYSLCGDPLDAGRYRIAVLLDEASRGGSAAMHGLAIGDVLRISPPRNGFPLAAVDPESDAPTLLFAGGVGITPILAMARELARQGAPFQLHYCVRTPSRAAFREELASIAGGDRERFDVHFHVDEQDGLLDVGAVLRGAGAASHLYVCGPKGFIDAVLGTAGSLGWADARLHCEYFSNAAAAQPQDGDQPFEVVLERSGLRTTVPPGTSIVEAVAALGVEIPTSCEQGVCGTCLTNVISGEPDHRDMVLDTVERASGQVILPCCSRSRGPRLVLDL